MHSPLQRLKATLFANPWRLAFWVLLVFVLVALLTIYSWWVKLTTPQVSTPPDVTPAGQGVPIEANVSLQSINRFVDMQLQKKETPVKDAQILFENQRIRTDTAIDFFGRTINLSMWLKPHVLENGDLRLVAEDVQVGAYPIPLKTLFAVLEGLPWPPWVHVQSEQYTLEFRFSERPDENKILLRNIDWAKQRLQLEIQAGSM